MLGRVVAGGGALTVGGCVWIGTGWVTIRWRGCSEKSRSCGLFTTGGGAGAGAAPRRVLRHGRRREGGQQRASAKQTHPKSLHCVARPAPSLKHPSPQIGGYGQNFSRESMSWR